jgi:4-aminobutyrate aminotransferase-like enzyme
MLFCRGSDQIIAVDCRAGKKKDENAAPRIWKIHLLSNDRYCGANPVSAAAACAVLDVIKEEGIQDHAKNMGQVVSKHLNNVLNNYEACIEVRGRGLMWGIEFEPSIARYKVSTHIRVGFRLRAVI